MLLQVAESLVEHGGIDEADLVARGVGGEPVTRTIPAAIAFAAAGPDATIDAAQRLCRLTTDDADTIEACVALHLALADALAGRDHGAGSATRDRSRTRSCARSMPETARALPPVVRARWPEPAGGSARSRHDGLHRCTESSEPRGTVDTTS